MSVAGHGCAEWAVQPGVGAGFAQDPLFTPPRTLDDLPDQNLTLCPPDRGLRSPLPQIRGGPSPPPIVYDRFPSAPEGWVDPEPTPVVEYTAGRGYELADPFTAHMLVFDDLEVVDLTTRRVYTLVDALEAMAEAIRTTPAKGDVCLPAFVHNQPIPYSLPPPNLGSMDPPGQFLVQALDARWPAALDVLHKTLWISDARALSGTHFVVDGDKTGFEAAQCCFTQTPQGIVPRIMYGTRTQLQGSRVGRKPTHAAHPVSTLCAYVYVANPEKRERTNNWSILLLSNRDVTPPRNTTVCCAVMFLPASTIQYMRA